VQLAPTSNMLDCQPVRILGRSAPYITSVIEASFLAALAPHRDAPSPSVTPLETDDAVAHPAEPCPRTPQPMTVSQGSVIYLPMSTRVPRIQRGLRA